MNKLLLNGIVAVGVVVSSASYGEEAVVRPYANLGYQMYEFVSVYDGGDYTVDADYMALGGGVTVSIDRIYVDVNYVTSLSAEFEDSDNDGGDFQRNDLAIAVGYAFPSGFSAFGGYKVGESESDFDDENFGTDTFDTDGFFFGGSYFWAVNETVQLSVNLAVALLDGEYEAKWDDGDRAFGDGDTVGASFGFSASKMISDSISLAAFVKRQSYSYDIDSLRYVSPYFPSEDIDTSDVDWDEDITTIGASISFIL